MNRKGETTLGLLVMSAIAVLIATAFWTQIGNDTGTLTKTFTVINQSKTAAAANGVIVLNGQKVVGTPIVINASNYDCSDEFTFGQRVGSDNTLEATMKTNGDAEICVEAPVKVTYTYEPKGYLSDSGSRAVFKLIVVFLALGLVAITLIPILKSGIGEIIKS